MKLAVLVGTEERIVTVVSLGSQKSIISEAQAPAPTKIAHVGSAVSSAMRKTRGSGDR